VIGRLGSDTLLLKSGSIYNYWVDISLDLIRPSDLNRTVQIKTINIFYLTREDYDSDPIAISLFIFIIIFFF
jgi:hypothetical protein